MDKTEIRKLLSSDKLIIGTDRVVNALRAGELSGVLVASNCDASTQDSLTHYASMQNVDVTSLDVTNEDLGVFCKKPFNIMVLGIRS